MWYRAAAATWSTEAEARRHWHHFMAWAMKSLFLEMTMPTRAPQAEKRLETESMTMTLSSKPGNCRPLSRGSPA